MNEKDQIQRLQQEMFDLRYRLDTVWAQWGNVHARVRDLCRHHGLDIKEYVPEIEMKKRVKRK